MSITRVRVYRQFAVWANGVVTSPHAKAWDDEGETLADKKREENAVTAAEKVIADRPTTEPCTDTCEAYDGDSDKLLPCRGWNIFFSGEYGAQVERDDTCAKFADDDEALAAALKFFDEHCEQM